MKTDRGAGGVVAPRPARIRLLLQAVVLLSLFSQTASQTYYRSCSEAKSHGQITGATYITNLGQVYCDQDTFNGGWMLVANIANTGAFGPYNLNLAPTGSYGTYSAAWDKTTHYYKAFNALTSADDYKFYLFMTGNLLFKCAAYKSEIIGDSGNQYQEDKGALTVTVRLGEGVTKSPGAGNGVLTNVRYIQSKSVDPHFSCEGGYFQNLERLLFAEGGKTGRTDFKNSNGGVGFFVRAIADPLPTPPPAPPPASSRAHRAHPRGTEVRVAAAHRVAPNLSFRGSW